jgi:prevent-host-death family protein
MILEPTTLDLPTKEIRRSFSDTLSRACFGKESIVLTRRNKSLAILTFADKKALSFVKYTVTSSEARDNLADLLNRVHYGKEAIGIERRGITVAVVVTQEMYQEILTERGLGKKYIDVTDIVERARASSPQRRGGNPRLGDPKP